MSRIDLKFESLRARNKKAFIPYVTAGYPDMATTGDLVLEFERRGADIVELGIPFSDPIADGPVIQQASGDSLAAGTTARGVLDLVKSLRRQTQIPLAAMSYINPILKYGVLAFLDDALEAGLDAVIIPDLPPEEEGTFLEDAARRGLDTVLFVSPTTPAARARAIAVRAKGFIYFVSLTGVTGARQALPTGLKDQLIALKKIVKGTPVCAGFGISTPEQVRDVSSVCDGVIVGSAIMRKLQENLKAPDRVTIVGGYMSELKGQGV